jgi:hypothetical protein
MSSDTPKFQLGSFQYLTAVLFLFLLFLLAGCGTTRTYTPHTAAGPAKPAGYPIPIYSVDMRIPRPCQLIGEFSVGDTQLTMFGGDMKGVMKTLMETAHEKGADVVELTSIRKPDFESAHYRVEANLLRYADQWETVSLSENDFLTYLQKKAATLDPIEGIWSDGSPDRIGILRDKSKPGRDFIAFMLNVQKGYKKMDIARDARPAAYSFKYYRDDFGMAKTTALLDHDRAFSFIVNTEAGAAEVIYVKIGAPRPVK